MIYLDYNSTTKIAPEVLAKMLEAYQLPLNNSATHQLGRKANKFVEDAKGEIEDFLNAKNYETIFTGSSSEATNTVFFGTDVEVILFSKTEHNSVYNCRPSDKKIVEIEVLENGLIDFSDLEKKLEEIFVSRGSGKFLISVMLAHNETGVIQDVEKIAKLAHQKGGLMHCDIVQAAGKIAVDLEKLNVDFASISAHKLQGPQGVGALLMRKGLDIKPLILGGKQQKSKRAGTLNIAGIAGFGEACKLAKNNLKNYEAVKKLRDFLEEEIQKITKDAKDDIKNFDSTVARLPNTSYIGLCGVDSQTQLINFDLNGICVSAGAACSSGTVAESRVLKAMKVAPEFSNSAIRVTLGPDNNKEEIEKFILVWSEFYKKMKQ